ncbi:unnamed protein product [Heterosigma akashiwo]
MASSAGKEELRLKTCHECLKEVPTSNFLLHRIHCKGSAHPLHRNENMRVDAEERCRGEKQEDSETEWELIGPSEAREPQEMPACTATEDSATDRDVEGWSCATCTFINRGSSFSCEMCAHERQYAEDHGWTQT